MRVLVVNAGSSSTKLSVIGDRDETLCAAELEGAPGDGIGNDLDRFLDAGPAVDGAGHRVVHGGARYEAPLLLDSETDAALADLAELAPLHNPPALAAIAELRRRRPRLPQVACFDTSFHVTMPPRAATYAVPARWRDDSGVRKFGFHGLSHAWASRRAAELLGRPLQELGTVTAHLGSGASLAAVSGGRSIDTTMGFTPIDGLVMATRSGSIDPGALLWVLRHRGLDVDQAERDLERSSGLLGLSGRSGDLREVVAGARAGDPLCALAYDVFVYRIQTSVGSLAVALGVLDALVFTGGAGEGSGELRRDVCHGLAVLGVRLGPDPAGTAADGGDRVLTGAGVTPSVLVVRSREDLEIARHVRGLLGR